MARVCGSTMTFSRIEPNLMAWWICGSDPSERRIVLA
jgi:hypothetical protein